MTGSPRRSDLPLAFRLNAERLSATWRRRLGATSTCRLDTDALVQEIGLPLLALTELAHEVPQAAYRLYTSDSNKFSAAAVCDSTQALAVVYNDGHEAPRQRADIAHECAHLILGHQPTAVFDEAGLRVYPEALEAEASWLGPTLLVPRAGLITVLEREPRLEAAAKHFDVSIQLARFVYNTRGCKQHVRLAA